LVQKLIALKCKQKVLNFRKIYTPKFLGCYTQFPVVNRLFAEYMMKNTQRIFYHSATFGFPLVLESHFSQHNNYLDYM
jgi:hypothetical protein